MADKYFLAGGRKLFNNQLVYEQAKSKGLDTLDSLPAK
jgi:hypothetical protein